MIASRRRERGVEPLVIEEIGKESDELQQEPRDAGADDANCDRHQGDGQYARRCGEVTEFFRPLLAFMQIG